MLGWLPGRPRFPPGARVFDFREGKLAAHPVIPEISRKKPRDAPQDQHMRHTISVLVENKFGVLTRVSGL
ncbi:MAG: hypothetical protein ACKOET_04390, partial [Verrucomicrobiota bacterium]